MAPPTNAAAIGDYVIANFVKGISLQKGSKPGFCHAMKLSYNTIDKHQVSTGLNSLTYRYKLSPDVPKYTVGLFTALMDELSTSACYRVGLPAAPGLSLQMQTELVPNAKLDTLEEVDIVNIVTKLGKTISHTRTDFRCADSNDLIAFSSHVKYMPTGSTIMDLVFNNRFISELYYRFMVHPAKVPMYDEKPLFTDVLRSHLEYQNPGRATFHVTREHTNPFGALHGGCHAMVMEQVAESYAKKELNCETVILEAMQIDYLGAGKGSLDVVCETIGIPSKNTIHVRVLLKRGERICSEGKLRLVSLNSRL